MAARNNRNQARRNNTSHTPGWVWLIAGMAIMAVILLVVPNFLKNDNNGFVRPGPQPNSNAIPRSVVDDEVIPATNLPTPPDDTTTTQSQFTFYTELPGREVRMSDEELAASARAERNHQTTTTPLPTPIPETTTPPRNTPPLTPQAILEGADTNNTTSTNNRVTTAPANNTVASNNNVRYILQAGAYGAAADADTAKAKVTMLGLQARVEPGQIQGKTVYRVRMGPYNSASELAQAKATLTASGLESVAIKAQ